MKVKYAAHALSNTMAAVLKMMAWRDDNAEAIGETAYVIEQLDKLFDCTNGPASSKDIKKGIRENVSEKTNHVASWNYYLKIMQTLKFINATTFKESKNVRCIKGFQISLNSLKDIWSLLNKAGFKYLNLRQLNQDSLENLFGNIRQHSVTNKNPTCSHFTAALKSCIISGLTGPHSRGSNCEADSNELFMTFVELNRLSRKEDSKSAKPANLLEEIEIGYYSSDISYPVLSLPEDPTIEEYELDLYSFEDQPVVYVSGYLAAKLLNKSTCINCKQFLSIDDPKDDNLYNYVSFREWWQNKRTLTYPSKKLCQCVNDAKKYYEATLSNRIHKLNIGQECCLQLNINCDFAWLRCQKHYVEVTENLIRSLSSLFIRKTCKIINDQYKVTESELAAKKKLMQQQRMEANK
ncbi:uncharacterized protein LOC123703869 [Colias croceus]|uniref:uncharacterized protein LOC123703869 n=1 Tax=Colias crocea TaxID=72248 RepID=UPI001E27DD0E|nr:uncharacterized protein LOC123703869 [Colias croceus]